jgi:Leucine-rich repeat (LRR) protein
MALAAVPEAGQDLLGLLPRELLLHLRRSYLPPGSGAVMRDSCRWLCDWWDEGSTKLTLGLRVHGDAPDNDAVVRMVQRLPGLASLRVTQWWPRVRWGEVLAAAAPGLRSLEVAGCVAQDVPLPAIAVAPCAGSLQRLCLHRSGARVLDALAPCMALRHLDLSCSTRLDDLGALAALTALQHLDLSGCTQVDDLEPLRALAALQHLDLSYCAAAEDLGPLAALAALRELHMGHCQGVTHLDALGALTALRCLVMPCCQGVTDLGALSACAALQVLQIGDCTQVAGLAPLAACTALQRLQISRCSRVTDLAPLHALTALELLDISHCDNITDLAPLEGCTALRHLNMWGSRATDLTPLTALRHLSTRNGDPV